MAAPPHGGLLRRPEQLEKGRSFRSLSVELPAHKGESGQ